MRRLLRNGPSLVRTAIVDATVPVRAEKPAIAVVAPAASTAAIDAHRNFLIDVSRGGNGPNVARPPYVAKPIAALGIRTCAVVSG